MKKIVYYYAYLDGNYKLIVQDQLSKILLSGLYDDCDSVEFCIASNHLEYIEWTKNLVSEYSKINTRVISIDKSQYPADFHEFKIALRYLKAMADTENGYYCFIHAKGISNTSYIADLWRLSMDYATIWDWKKNIEMLESGYDAVGPNLRYDTFLGYYPHFSGCYWWATHEHIRSLTTDYLYNTDNKYLEEFWIGSNHQAKLGSTFECDHNEPYLIETTIKKYIKK